MTLNIPPSLNIVFSFYTFRMTFETSTSTLMSIFWNFRANNRSNAIRVTSIYDRISVTKSIHSRASRNGERAWVFYFFYFDTPLLLFAVSTRLPTPYLARTRTVLRYYYSDSSTRQTIFYNPPPIVVVTVGSLLWYITLYCIVNEVPIHTRRKEKKGKLAPSFTTMFIYVCLFLRSWKYSLPFFFFFLYSVYTNAFCVFRQWTPFESPLPFPSPTPRPVLS